MGVRPENPDTDKRVVFTTHMDFGTYVRDQRRDKQQMDRRFSLRQVAERVGIQPTYLSKIERGELPPSAEQTTLRIAEELGLTAMISRLAMAGKVSRDLREIICERPHLFSKLLREMRAMPDHAVLTLIRETTDGNW